MKIRQFILQSLAATCGLYLAGCASTGALPDAGGKPAGGAGKRGLGNVTVSVFRDARGLGAHHLGQVRTGTGISFNTVETSIPVNQLVAETFGSGLQARGMAGKPGTTGWRLGGVIKEFSCDQVVRSGANAEISVVLYQPGTTTPTFRKTYHAEKSEVSFAIGDTGVLKNLATLVLQEIVDLALDDPELRLHTDRKH